MDDLAISVKRNQLPVGARFGYVAAHRVPGQIRRTVRVLSNLPHFTPV
ncbi:hypothetical protein [Levilactobacillus sp. HBUAS67488]